MKDSNDTIFGAYVGDGVHKGRGYYGSGESSVTHSYNGMYNLSCFFTDSSGNTIGEISRCLSGLGT
jgi:hypothetical protein